MRLIATSVISLLVGLGLGWLAFHQERSVSAEVVAPASTAPVAAPVREAAPAKPPVPLVHAATEASPAATPPTSAPAPASAPGEVERLRARVTQLEATLESELKLRRSTEGAEVPVPAGLAPRFRDEQQLVSTFNAALKEAGFPGQVTSVDCSEHPCIVFGTGFGDRGDMEKLTSTPAFATYAKDSFPTFGFQRGKDATTAERFFGVAVLPATGEPPAEDLGKRIAFRVRQMEEASRPPKK